MLFGYQGWFLRPGDGSPVNGWRHWFRNDAPTAANLTIDLWPDTSELGADELIATDLAYADGSVARLYSAYNAKTVARHFAWMKQAGIDGVALQRFLSEVQDPRFFAARNQVTRNVQAGAEAEGRVFAIEYDVTGVDDAHLVEWLEADWKYLVDTLKVTASPRYLKDGGKPVLYLWGLGFSDRPGTPADAARLIDWLTTSADPQYRVTLVGGVPAHWRTLDGDSKRDAAWARVYRSFDVLSPWTVGRFGDDAGADAYRASGSPPTSRRPRPRASATCRSCSRASPGTTSTAAPRTEIPRRGGAFYWRQVWNAVGAGATMLKTAMFDEVDEGTAMFKLAPTAAKLPTGASLVPLDADGRALPSDFYLRVGGAATALLRGDLPISPRCHAARRAVSVIASRALQVRSGPEAGRGRHRGDHGGAGPAAAIGDGELHRIVVQLAAMGEEPDARHPIEEHGTDEPEHPGVRVGGRARALDVEAEDQHRHEAGRRPHRRDHLEIRGEVTATQQLVALADRLAQLHVALGKREAEEEEHAERQQPGADRYAGGIPAGDDPVGVEPGQRDDVDQELFLEVQRVGEREAEVEGEHHQEWARQGRGGDAEAERQQQDDHGPTVGERQDARGERAVPLGGVLAVGSHVEEIVDHVPRRRTEADREGRQRRCHQRAQRGVLGRQDDRHQHERVLRPLVHPQHPDRPRSLPPRVETSRSVVVADAVAAASEGDPCVIAERA